MALAASGFVQSPIPDCGDEHKPDQPQAGQQPWTAGQCGIFRTSTLGLDPAVGGRRWHVVLAVFRMEKRCSRFDVVMPFCGWTIRPGPGSAHGPGPGGRLLHCRERSPRMHGGAYAAGPGLRHSRCTRCGCAACCRPGRGTELRRPRQLPPCCRSRTIGCC